MPDRMNAFEEALLVTGADIAVLHHGFSAIPHQDYLLNPRRLRGSDFLMRWSQGVWSENRIKDAVNALDGFLCIEYGPSGVAPDHDVRAFELYFEELEAAGLGDVKRPDLLVFTSADQHRVEEIVRELGGLERLPFVREDAGQMQELLGMALLAIECENSLWVAKEMPNYGEELRPQRRLDGKPGLPKSTVVPTVIVKQEDLEPLQRWQADAGVPIHIWHVFFDLAFGISLDRVRELIGPEGLIDGTPQTFQAPGGANTSKMIYKIYYHYAYRVGAAVDDPEMSAAFIQDKNGHVLPYVRFEGGAFDLESEALDVLQNAR